MKNIFEATRACLAMALDDTNIRSAIAYLDPKLRVKLTRRGKKTRARGPDEFVLTMGRPDCDGRAFVKACKAAGEPFPVKKIQIRHYPKKARKGHRKAAR